MSELLHLAQVEAARLREVLDLFDVGVCIVDRSGDDPAITHANLALHDLAGGRVETLADLVDLLGSGASSAVGSSLPDHHGGALGTAVFRATGRMAAISLHVLEADLHDSVVLLFEPH
jgi:hypothetical protein